MRAAVLFIFIAFSLSPAWAWEDVRPHNQEGSSGTTYHKKEKEYCSAWLSEYIDAYVTRAKKSMKEGSCYYAYQHLKRMEYNAANPSRECKEDIGWYEIVNSRLALAKEYAEKIKERCPQVGANPESQGSADIIKERDGSLTIKQSKK